MDRYLVLSSWQLALTDGHLALGTWHLALGTWHLALGTWHLALTDVITKFVSRSTTSTLEVDGNVIWGIYYYIYPYRTYPNYI
jgi:hypothetical protein